MALKVVGVSVVDNNRNIVNVNNVNIAGISTATTIKVGSAVTIGSNGSSGGITVSGIVTATSYIGSGSSLTGLTGASAGTYGSSSQVAQILVDSDNRITSISNVNISGGGGGGSTTEGIGTALSADTSSILSVVYTTPKSYTIADNTTVTIQSDSGSDNFAYTKLDQIVVGSGAVLVIGNGTILRMNILNIF